MIYRKNTFNVRNKDNISKQRQMAWLKDTKECKNKYKNTIKYKN